MHGYKIVFNKKADGQLTYISFSRGMSCVTYPVGKPAVPKPGCGPLAVFSSLDAACHFLGVGEVNLAQIYSIWLCEYTPSGGDLPVERLR